MTAATHSNEITLLYYRTLVSHSWSRHKVQKVYRGRGRYTYHLTGS